MPVDLAPWNWFIRASMAAWDRAKGRTAGAAAPRMKFSRRAASECSRRMVTKDRARARPPLGGGPSSELEEVEEVVVVDGRDEGRDEDQDEGRVEGLERGGVAML